MSPEEVGIKRTPKSYQNGGDCRCLNLWNAVTKPWNKKVEKKWKKVLT